MKVLNLIVAIWRLVAKYPALSAGVFNVIILAGTQIGLHLTTAQLSTLAGTVAAVFAVLVHAGVIPVTKVANVKAGVKPTVPVGVAVSSAESDAKALNVPVYAPTTPNRVVPVETELRPATPSVSIEVKPPPSSQVGESVTTYLEGSDKGKLGKPINPRKGN